MSLDLSTFPKLSTAVRSEVRVSDLLVAAWYMRDGYDRTPTIMMMTVQAAMAREGRCTSFHREH